MKRFVVDTCIFIDDPDCISKFADNEVIVPFKVVEELDKHKENNGSRGEGARAALRNIYNYSQQGKLSVGVRLESGGLFRVDTLDPTTVKFPTILDFKDADNSILAVAYANRAPNVETVLITNDINLKVKAESVDIKTEKYENRTVKKAEHLFEPFCQIDVSTEMLDTFMYEKRIAPPEGSNLYPNQNILMKGSSKQSALGRFNKRTGKIEALQFHERQAMGIRGKNLEQRFAMDLLMDDDIRLVSLIGKAGTGKTIMAIAAAIQKTMHDQQYNKIVVARPIVTLAKGHEVGFLPGSLKEKLTPWMQPILDNLEIIMDIKTSDVEKMLESGQLEFCALSYIRGRNIENAFIIVDEAQQLFPRESKAIITRVGEHSKIVLTGDPYQVDHQYLDEYTNGFSYVVEKFKNQEIAGHAVLTKCERSALASIAADIL